MLDNIHHLAIQVKNINESISWYREKFNLNVKYQDDSWALLEFDNISIALVSMINILIILEFLKIMLSPLAL